MSSIKRLTKARVTPGSVVGLTPDSLVSSSCHKVGGAKNKGSAPEETETPRTTLRTTAAAFTPKATAKPSATTAAYQIDGIVTLSFTWIYIELLR
jgi:hypothetical protein